MNPFILYMVKAALSLAALYIVYQSFLGRDTMYERNRFFILLSILGSLIFPLIVIETRQPIDIQFFGKDLTGVIIDKNPDLFVNPAEVSPALMIYNSIIIIYLSGLVLFSIRTIAEFLSLIYLIIRQKNREDNIIRLKNHRNSGFSAFGYIFIDARLSNDVAADIIKHEQNHLKNFHFLDILLIEVLKAVQWFNPFIYLVDKSLREVHEFQADEECLNSGITVKRYQGLLLNQVFRTNVFNASDGFSNPTIIKKRIIMMTRKRSRTLTNLKMLMTLPVITLLLISFSTSSTDENLITSISGPAYYIDPYPSLPSPPVINVERNTSDATVRRINSSSETEKEPYAVVEKMPVFPGGDSQLLKYLDQHTRYPESAIANNITGRVVVRFCVTETGRVAKTSVLKGIDPLLDAEAVRVVSSLPAFQPGYEEGVAVPVWYMVPVTFSLKMNEASIPPQTPSPVAESEPVQMDVTDSGEQYEQRVDNYEPFFAAEQMPRFPGGDKELIRYIARNTNYPESAKTDKIMGRVTIRFCVTESGNVDKVSVLKGVDPSLDAEAARVVASLPDFEPGRQGGKEVPVWYLVPVIFTIR
jgi:TonB family protein